MLQRRSDKVKKVIRECGQRSTVTEKISANTLRLKTKVLLIPASNLSRQTSRNTIHSVVLK